MMQAKVGIFLSLRKSTHETQNDELQGIDTLMNKGEKLTIEDDIG